MATESDTGLMPVNGVEIAYTVKGRGPPVLLLHGFPQTRAMWGPVTQVLAQRHTVVMADLRGYGGSGKPGLDRPQDCAAYSFRAMGLDQFGLMSALGFERFHLVGHDRGARVAHRMALDDGARLASLTLMDIVPTHLLLTELHHAVARSYFHWFFLAQPHPFPEQMIATDPDYFFESCLLGWGGATLEDFAPAQMAAYRDAWRDPAVIFGMCQDYRAALDHDLAQDAQAIGAKFDGPSLVLFGAQGAMAQHFDVPATWGPWLANMQAQGIAGGHFFPDTAPSETAQALRDFLGAQADVVQR
ncbi:alpha/beta fold hydrolase [Roseinatronobacter monicus]|uniref:Haloacetate dehalogenase n=1 Tax=Roseinatronobacter monicus TaxID=393481 RepID=A0A543KDU2_9RHOB|nr:alpha/beta hydrolase [Roseinatronobacter monicus]TQM93204.1 haloacetate dehalogenase [Roseinatronobacter monicus]